MTDIAERGCWWCGLAVEPSARFCPACGARDHARDHGASRGPDPGLWPAEGENRMLTVMFPDLSGYMRASRQAVGDEAVHLVSAVLGTYIDAVSERGGYVARCMHDEVLALFGLPAAHPDDPARALEAAIAIRGAIRELGLDVKIGVNTGLLYFGPVGNRRHSELAVVGPAGDAAARLVGKGAKVAEAGEILVGETTAHLASSRFRFGEPRVLSLKGIAGPVTAYELVGDGAAETGAAETGAVAEPATQAGPTARRWIELAAVIDPLSRTRRHWLQVAALVGERFSSAVLDRLEGFGGGCAAQLDPLVAGGLLDKDGGDYRFVDPDLAVVLASTPIRARRADLHRRIAAALEPDSATDAAEHRRAAEACEAPLRFGDRLRL